MSNKQNVPSFRHRLQTTPCLPCSRNPEVSRSRPCPAWVALRDCLAPRSVAWWPTCPTGSLSWPLDSSISWFSAWCRPSRSSRNSWAPSSWAASTASTTASATRSDGSESARTRHRTPPTGSTVSAVVHFEAVEGKPQRECIFYCQVFSVIPCARPPPFAVFTRAWSSSSNTKIVRCEIPSPDWSLRSRRRNTSPSGGSSSSSPISPCKGSEDE